jgi:hypothetical protein
MHGDRVGADGWVARGHRGGGHGRWLAGGCDGQLAPLRCGTGGRVEPAPGRRSDSLGEFGERGGVDRGDVGQQWGEPLHAPVNGDVVDLDAALDQ